MKTDSRRTLRHIVASGKAELRKELANQVLTDLITGNQVRPIETLKQAAVSLFVSFDDTEARTAAADVLSAIDARNIDLKAVDLALLMNGRMKDKLAEFAVVPSIAEGGARRLFEAVAIKFALPPKDSLEKKNAMKMLEILDTDQTHAMSTFQQLLRIGALGQSDLAKLLALRKELASLKERREAGIVNEEKQESHVISTMRDGGFVVEFAGKKITLDGNKAFNRAASLAFWSGVDGQTALSIVKGLLSLGIIQYRSDLQDLDRGLDQMLTDRSLISHVNFRAKPREEGATIIPLSISEMPIPAESEIILVDEASAELKPTTGSGIFASAKPIDENMTADELRSSDYLEKILSRQMMYRLICAECFRLGTSKAIIGEGYVNVAAVQSNLTRKINGKKQHNLLFAGCWDDMRHSGAIKLKKSGDVASLNPHLEQITDPEIRRALEWAFSEHRRLAYPRAVTG